MKNKSVYHWLIVAACSGLAMAAIGISINCAGIFFESVSEDLGVGRGDVSLTVTLTNVLTGLMGPLVASRLFGRVNIKVLTGVGFLLLLIIALLATGEDDEHDGTITTTEHEEGGASK